MKPKIHFLKAEFKGNSYPSFPSWEKSAEIFGVHGLLYEQIHLPTHTEHGALLHAFQLLLQSHQYTLRYLVETLVSITNDKNTKALKEVEQVKGPWEYENLNN